MVGGIKFVMHELDRSIRRIERREAIETTDDILAGLVWLGWICRSLDRAAPQEMIPLLIEQASYWHQDLVARKGARGS